MIWQVPDLGHSLVGAAAIHHVDATGQGGIVGTGQEQAGPGRAEVRQREDPDQGCGVRGDPQQRDECGA